MELRVHFGSKHCFLASSGKAALTLILRAIHEMHPGRDEVLIPAFTCYSVPSAIVRAGLKVRLCDVDPSTLDFDFENLLRLLSPHSCMKRLLAIIPTHLFGLSADVGRLRSLLRDPEVTIVEDAAQSMGSERNGKKLGTLGDVGFFSVGRGKALSFVEGGIILTDRDDISETLKAHIDALPHWSYSYLAVLIFKALSITFFLRPSLFWVPKSIPFLRLGETIFDPRFRVGRMSPFQASLARDWQMRLEKFACARRKNSQRWAAILKRIGPGHFALINGGGIDLIRFPVRIFDAKQRKAVLKESGRLGLGIMPTYPDSIDGIPELFGALQDQHFPAARDCAHQLVTLPVHSFVTDDDAMRIRATLEASGLCRKSDRMEGAV